MPAEHLFAFEEPGAETLRVPVLKVFDGDGFLTQIRHPLRNVTFEATVRFGFIDAPEMEQPGGQEAKDFLSSLIGDRWLELVILTKMDTGQIVDRHGRIVCVPYLADERSRLDIEDQQSVGAKIRSLCSSPIVTRNIELEMVLNGWAWVLERYGPEDSYFDALEDARRYRRGIWAYDNNVHPWEFKKAKYRELRSRHRSAHPKGLFDVPDPQQCCPTKGCSGVLIQRNGRFGPFLGCSNYPRCRYSCALPS